MCRTRKSIAFSISAIVSTLILAAACDSPETQEARTGSEYAETINAWHQKRVESLKESDSWLSLAGLYPLEEGSHSFGADPSNDIVFPEEKAPAMIGRLIVDGDQIRARIQPGVTVYVGETAVRDTILRSDAEGDPTILSHGSLEWYAIERGGTLFLRLKDNNHPNFEAFDGIERFPVSRKWRVKAEFQAIEPPDSIGIPNVLGQVNRSPLYGRLVFELDGETYTLAPLGDPESDDEFFIIFGDETNGESTYGGGRFVYADTPGEDGVTYIDFNKAYNPPCVFTDYATCPLPPPQNRLDAEIQGGEKNYGDTAQASVLEPEYTRDRDRE